MLPGAILLRPGHLRVSRHVLRVIDVSLGVLVMAFATESLAGSLHACGAERRREMCTAQARVQYGDGCCCLFSGKYHKSDTNGRVKKKKKCIQYEYDTKSTVVRRT